MVGIAEQIPSFRARYQVLLGNVGTPSLVWRSRRSQASSATYPLLVLVGKVHGASLMHPTLATLANSDLLIALALPISDCEDAMQCAAAMNGEATFIVTRNLADYQNAPIQAVTPEQVLTIVMGSN